MIITDRSKEKFDSRFISKILFLLILFLFSYSNAFANCGKNIVFIIVDDLGYADFSAQSMPKTHALFDSKGTSLNLYSHQNCVPSRAAFFSGLNPASFNQHGVFPPPINAGVPPEMKLLPEYLKDAGYTTGAFGKWHLGWNNSQVPNQNGFDEFVGILSGHINSFGTQPLGIPYPDGTIGHDHHSSHDMLINGIPLYSSRYSTHLFADAATEFIEKTKAPFFAYVAFNAPHSPWHAPQDSFDTVKSAFAITSEDEQFLSQYASNVVGLPLNSPAPTDTQLRINRAMYYAMVLELDNSINDIWDSVVKSGHENDTFFMFVSDNGGVVNIADNGILRGGKGSPYQGGHYVANGVIAPCVSNNQSVQSNVWFADLMPTVLELAELSVNGLDGASAMPALMHNQEIYRNGTRSFPSHIDKRYSKITDTVRASVAINVTNFKYVKFVTFDSDGLTSIDSREELYNLKLDPGESTNIVNSEVYAGLLNRMRNQYDYWVGDEMLANLKTIDSRQAWVDFVIPDEWNAYSDVLFSEVFP